MTFLSHSPKTPESHASPGVGVRLTYLAVDSVEEGIGASQVLAYVERMPPHDVQVTLHTFEKTARSISATAQRLGAAGVEWHPLPFGRRGTLGGLGRIARAAFRIRGAEMVHARSDLAGAAAMLARPRRWIWDARSLYADQKIELGELKSGSPQEVLLRRIERACALQSDAIVVLTEAGLEVLVDRYGKDLTQKATVVPTCVDLGRFELSPLPELPTRFLLAGTINSFYDVPAMMSFFRRFREGSAAELHVVTPGPTRWDTELAQLATSRSVARPEDMPALIAASHVGLCVCRDDAGISLAASMPTKIAEFLATGRPLVVNSKLGDAGGMLEAHGAGVALRSGSDGLILAVDQLRELLRDPETPLRCRALAEEHFDLEVAVKKLVNVYRSLG